MKTWPTNPSSRTQSVHYGARKLGEVLEYEQPTKYLVSSTDYKDEYTIPVLTAGKSFVLGNTNEKNGIFPKEKLPVIIFDDFTTAIKFVDFPFKVKSSAMKILHAKKNEADIRFLFYKMLTIKFAHDQHKRYWISECSNLKVSLPPLKIQKQIVERLDKIAEAQKLNDELIQKTDELFQSLLHKELNSTGKNWEVKKLGNLLELCDAGVWGKATNDRGMLVLRSTNFKNGGTLDFSNVPELKIDEKKRAKVKLMDNDILLEKSGGGPDQPVGRVVYFIAPDQRDYTFANFIQRLRPNSDVVNSNFLFYHLFRLYNIGYTKKLQSQTTGIRNLKLSLYLKTEIPLPPLKTQKQIVIKLSAVQDYKKQLLEQKAKLKELFDSVLAKSMKN